MSANTSPIYSLPSVGSPKNIAAANTKSDGTGTIATDIYLVYTAGTNGSWISKVRFSTAASVAGTTSTATVGRVYLSSKTSGATTGGTDTFLLGEVTLPSVTADSTTNPTNPVELPLNMAIPSGYTILVSTHAAPAASTSQHAVVFGGDF